MGFVGTFVPIALAAATALFVDWSTLRRGLTPPGFLPPAGIDPGPEPALRRAVAITLLAVLLWVAVFGALGAGKSPAVDMEQTPKVTLFLLHIFFVIFMAAWYLLGFTGVPATTETLPRSWVSQFGLRTPRLGTELAVGVVAGLGAWMAVLGCLLLIGLLLYALGGEELLPSEPAPMIPWIAALPVGLRVGISMSAGFFEEAFFRGFLQPRAGIALSTALFVLAHASYEQPLMLVGVGLLSLVFAGLVKWRQNIWPAIAAHTIFDLIQLLVVVPMALEFLEGAEPVTGLF